MTLNDAQLKLILLAALSQTSISYEKGEAIADAVIQQAHEHGSILEMLIEELASHT